jgi:hypothetical protein
MRTLAAGKSSLTSNEVEVDVTPTSNVGAHISLNPRGWLNAKGSACPIAQHRPTSRRCAQCSTAAFYFDDHESRMSASSCDFLTQRTQLAGFGLRGTIPIGVKVYTASPRWL